MGEKFSLTVDAAVLNALLKHQIAPVNFMQELFAPSSVANRQEMNLRLIAYHNQEGGSPEIADFEIVDVKFNADTLSGSFRAKFKAHFNYTCSATTSAKADDITWDFTIDAQQSLIHFTGEEPWQSEPEGY